MGNDCYSVLGLPRNATSQQVRVRFLELARERHPDRFQGAEKAKAETEFQEITEAYNVLSDPDRRRQLDADLARPEMENPPVATQAAKAYLRRGTKAYREKNYPEAAENFDRATQEDPKDAQAWHYLAMTCSNRKRWLGRAANAAAKACELSPMNPTYLKLAGRLAARQGKVALAKKHYSEALTWGGEDPEVRMALEELESSRGKRRSKGFFGKT